ncbi:MAG TPA: hypothetical protein VGP33_01015 [Chloroflexota bacterium]|jgi:hypothetical protein|nr:hypothetical protein [Chloroflexota bacterium]
MTAFPSREATPTPAPDPLPFGANQRETLWRYRQAVWSRPAEVTGADRRNEANQAARQPPQVLNSASRASA